MTAKLWKVTLTYRNASPVGGPLTYRAVIDAENFDTAIAAAKTRFGPNTPPMTSAGQRMTDAEVAAMPQSGDDFVSGRKPA